MPIGILRWEDPAPRTPIGDQFAPIAAELRDHPGRWAVIAENPNTQEGRRDSNRLFNAVKLGYRGFQCEDGAYKATTRTVTASDGTKVIRVHAQFINNPR
ncbi:hypothetical protein ACFV0L_18780 [Streptosporangium canum]|uniref:hypothetical protein n=1 Tax=Streptosporangium canum TaxID=324952 RepID=UPI00367CE545